MLTVIILITINIISMTVGFFAGVAYWDERIKREKHERSDSKGGQR